LTSVSTVGLGDDCIYAGIFTNYDLVVDITIKWCPSLHRQTIIRVCVYDIVKESHIMVSPAMNILVRGCRRECPTHHLVETTNANVRFLALNGCCDGGDAHDDKNSCSQGHSSSEESIHPTAAAMIFAGRRGRRREEGGVLGRDGVVHLPELNIERTIEYNVT
jgi:hypothetical protein